jgi:hypothetical protein
MSISNSEGVNSMDSGDSDVTRQKPATKKFFFKKKPSIKQGYKT